MNAAPTHSTTTPARAIAPASPGTRPLLIGLVGRAGVGKSTVARMLEDECSFIELAFADPILAMVGALFAECDIDGAWTVERSLKELPTPLGFSYRRLAQTLGTEWGRNTVAQDLWLRVMELRLNAPHLQQDHVVISDVRFPNEAAFIRQRGGHLVRVLRPDRPQLEAHPSESHADDIPVTTELLNFGSQATLLDQVVRMVDTLKRAPQ